MLPNQISNAAGLPRPEMRSPQQKRSIFAQIAGIPRGLLDLVRAGKMAGASLRCLLASLLAFAFLFAWAVVAGIGLLVMVVPMAVVSEAPWANAVFNGLAALVALPAAIAGLIIFLGTLLGAALGFAGLFRSQDNKLLGVGSMVLNLLLLVFFLIMMLLAVGLAA